jgi:hypothetical protein
MKIHSLFLLSTTLVACQVKQPASTDDQNDKLNLKTALSGTWEAVSFRIQVNSLQNTDSSFVLEVKPGEWEKKLQIRPILTTYSTDNRYRSEYRSPADSLLRTDRGMWNAFGDTLVLISAEATYQYQVIWRGDTAEFRSFLDWDGDGQEDDEYVGIQKKK